MACRIPRREVEEINQVVMRELESIEADCKSIIAGGSVDYLSSKVVSALNSAPARTSLSYRRGKLESNDADIVISHTDWDRGADKVRGLCKKLVRRLQERGEIHFFR